MKSKIVYGLIGTLLLVSAALAIQKTFLAGTPAGNDEGTPAPRSSVMTVRMTHGPRSFLSAEEPAVFDVAAHDLRQDGTQPATSDWTPIDTRRGDDGEARGTARHGSNPLAVIATLVPSRNDASQQPGKSVPPLGDAGPASTTAPTTAEAAGGATQQAKAVYFGTNQGGVCNSGERTFHVEDVRDLYVCVVWSGVSGSHVQQVTFVSPDGHVYQKVSVPFVTGTASAGWGANGEVLVTAAIPVAGTFITQHTLVGLWTVKVALDGVPTTQDNFDFLTR